METNVTMSLKDYNELKSRADNQFKIELIDRDGGGWFRYLQDGSEVAKEINVILNARESLINDKLKEVDAWRKMAEEEYDLIHKYNSLPWWKRIFMPVHHVYKNE
jgi:hypothetical protein